MILERKNFSFLVQVIDIRYFYTDIGIRRAEFWIVWSFWLRNGEMLGNQMGAAYMKRDRISDF